MKRTLIASLLSAVLAGGVLWSARGIYDEALMDGGVFHVVNAVDQSRSIELTFPSGESRSAVIRAGQSTNFRVEDTGEGSFSVVADGETLWMGGYVTSHNSFSVVVVQSNTAQF
jgi:hypothetical protein